MAILIRLGVKVAPRFESDNFATAMSLVTSEQGVALLPISAEAYLPSDHRQPPS